MEASIPEPKCWEGTQANVEAANPVGGRRGKGLGLCSDVGIPSQTTEPEGTSGAQLSVQPPYSGFPYKGLHRKASPSLRNTAELHKKEIQLILKEVRLETKANSKEQLRMNVTPKNLRPNFFKSFQTLKILFF